MPKITESDLANLDEIYDAFGVGEAIRSGHLETVSFDSPELSEAAEMVVRGYGTIERIYLEAHKEDD